MRHRFRPVMLHDGMTARPRRKGRPFGRRALTVLMLSVLTAAVTAVVGPPPASAQPYCDRIPVPPVCDDLPEEPGSHNPTGVLSSVSRPPGGVQVSGEAQDPDSNTPVTVEIKIDGVVTGTLVANLTGGRFSGVVPARYGNQVCATARNIGQGVNTNIGCKDLAVRVDPFGAFESITPEGDKVRVKGWAIDPDLSSSLTVIARDGNGTLLANISANRPRPDVGAAHPGYGDAHGFDALLPEGAGDGQHQICLGALNGGPGVHADLGCETYTVRHQPYGSFDTLSRHGGTLRVGGWVADPDDLLAELAVRVSVDGTEYHGMADVARPGGGWTFDLPSVPAGTSQGSHGVCVSARNIDFGAHEWTEIDCRGYFMPGQLSAPVIRPLVKNDTLFWLRNELRWTNADDVEGIVVERSVADGPYTEVYRVNGLVDAYTDTDVRAGTRYCYRVTTTNSRPSQASAQVCDNSLLPAPQAPTDVRITGAGDTTLTVAWTDNAGTETGYRLEVRGGGTSRVVTLPAYAGTGPRQETVTGLSPVTPYTILVKPVQDGAADLADDQAGKAEGWTTGAPRIDAFSANPTRPRACQPVTIQLAWSVAGATRITVTRNGGQIFDESRATPGQWDDTLSGGSSDGNVTYLLTAHSASGQRTTKTVTVGRDIVVRLVKKVNFINVTLEPMRVYLVDAFGRELQLLDELIPGETYGYTLPNCQQVRVRVKTKIDGRVVHDTLDMLGHVDGLEYGVQVRNGGG
ncbi:fibronectin type III domain-containing protein [Phytohabitans kaempferiae]|uniref:Fibronectin type III domain-containing protein n=1 Tax=Phytohabitans kaempferiae TaxID=1620943 RepID=A0ABV6M4B5_9ACTN